MEQNYDSLNQLFRNEFAKMVAVITKLYGLKNIETAEDIVSETFLQAAETWGLKGIPENPSAWLYTVAKNKTLYRFRRNKIYNNKIFPELAANVPDNPPGFDPDFSLSNIKDSRLKMMFAVCSPEISSEAQISLALRILCGFGIDEIAEAFLVNKETINKRLYRAKEKLRNEKIMVEFPPESELLHRLDNVLRVIYLLFNEGYYSRTVNQVLRKDLCLEAMRLGILLTECESTALPETYALMALICFHSSRFEARQNEADPFILYDFQNEELWNKELINRGIYFLGLSANGDRMTSYHLEARIAYWHCVEKDTPRKWEEILELYNKLVKVNYSPGVLLNRVYALYKVAGEKPALVEAEKLELKNNHFYYLLLGELYKNLDWKKANDYYEKAAAFAKTDTEKKNIRAKIGEK